MNKFEQLLQDCTNAAFYCGEFDVDSKEFDKSYDTYNMLQEQLVERDRKLLEALKEIISDGGVMHKINVAKFVLKELGEGI